MSQENLQALRRAYDAWARGDFSRRELCDPNIEGVWAAELPDPHVDKGIEAFFASSREWLATWEEFRLEAEAFLPVEDKVVVLVVLRGKGKGSGAEVATPAAHVWTMRLNSGRVPGGPSGSKSLSDSGAGRGAASVPSSGACQLRTRRGHRPIRLRWLMSGLPPRV